MGILELPAEYENPTGCILFQLQKHLRSTLLKLVEKALASRCHIALLVKVLVADKHAHDVNLAIGELPSIGKHHIADSKGAEACIAWILGSCQRVAFSSLT